MLSNIKVKEIIAKYIKDNYYLDNAEDLSNALIDLSTISNSEIYVNVIESFEKFCSVTLLPYMKEYVIYVYRLDKVSYADTFNSTIDDSCCSKFGIKIRYNE